MLSSSSTTTIVPFALSITRFPRCTCPWSHFSRPIRCQSCAHCRTGERPPREGNVPESLSDPVGSDDLTQPVGRRLGSAGLRLAIDGDDAEAHPVPECPLEVV